jgi:predicted Zn-ribbon and HTH transcriptional regulator
MPINRRMGYDLEEGLAGCRKCGRRKRLVFLTSLCPECMQEVEEELCAREEEKRWCGPVSSETDDLPTEYV